MRLLSQPLYRYPAAGCREPWMGAVCVCARDRSGDLCVAGGRETEWRYGLVRMNDGVMTVLYRDKEAQRFERAAERDHEHDPYVLEAGDAVRSGSVTKALTAICLKSGRYS